MSAMIGEGREGWLEGLCHAADQPAVRGRRIRIGQGGRGLERIEAHFPGQAFAPHRHDTYAIGITIAGVQSFRYRGMERRCLAGQCHILHPDELHDGAAATEAGFAYRMIYIDPKLVQQALGGRPLPFVPSPVVDPSLLPEGFAREAWDMDGEIDEFSQTEIAVAATGFLLTAASGKREREPAPLALARLLRVRDLLLEDPARRYPLSEIERVCGLDRWTVARQFRALFGTSPSRFRTFRQLDQVRTLVRGGMGLVDAALAAGFSDQSHMTRQFKRAYGLSPGAWAAALA